MLNDLHYNLAVFKLYLDCIVDIRYFAGGKLDIDYRAYYPSDNSVFH